MIISIKKYVTLFLFAFISIAFLGCASNKKEVEPNALEKINSVGTFTVLWKKKFSDSDSAYGYRLLPVHGKDSLFVASQKGTVMSLNSETGVVNWEQDLEREISAGPGISNTLLAVGTPEGEVLTLDIDSGAILWTNQVSSEILAPPVIDRNRVVVRTQDGRIYGFSIQDGKREWVFDTNIPSLTLRGNSTPVAKAGRLYIGFDSGKVAALNIEDGSVLWQQNVVDNQGKTEIDRIADIDGEIAVLATELFISSVAGKIMAVASESGRVLWVQDFGSSTGVTVSRRSLYLSDNLSVLHQVNRTDGSVGWTQDSLMHRQLTRPAYYKGNILVGDLDGYVHVVDSDSGALLARERSGSKNFFGAPVVVADTFYTFNQDGTLSALQYQPQP